MQSPQAGYALVRRVPSEIIAAMREASERRGRGAVWVGDKRGVGVGAAVVMVAVMVWWLW